MLKFVRSLFHVALWGAALCHVHAAIPSALIVPLKSISPPSHTSVSADGHVYGIARQGGGAALIGFHGQVLELPPLPDVAPAGRSTDERIAINPDGKYVVHLLPQEFIIRDLPKGQVVWRGTLQKHFGNRSMRYHFDAPTKRLKVADDRTLTTFDVSQSGEAPQRGRVSILLAPAKHYYAQQTTFSADGQTLFLGTYEGEVIAADISQDTPQLRWRTKLFEPITREQRSYRPEVSELACADGCRTLMVQAWPQIALVNGATGRIQAKQIVEGRLDTLGSIGNDFYVLSASLDEGRSFSLFTVDRDLLPVDSPVTSKHLLALSFHGGVARQRGVAHEGHSQTELYFTDMLSTLKEKQQRQMQIQKHLPEFRRKLTSGSDSHCGLVIERKGTIALVETPIGQKWLKVAQLHQPQTRECRFINGVLPD
jgi:hypothetical protein